jgi:adenosylmethionine-8-amino-7-oxononanoate aminotransferase
MSAYRKFRIEIFEEGLYYSRKKSREFMFLPPFIIKTKKVNGLFKKIFNLIKENEVNK